MIMGVISFNPHLQNEPEFVASFVARQKTLLFYMQQLRLVQSEQPAHHHLIVAPRGFGKTSLLRRIAIAVRQDDDSHSRFIPLKFREEQHNVISLDVFWRNCIQSLLEAREDEGAGKTELDAIDAKWAELPPRQALPREQQDGEPSWRALYALCAQLGRRPVLLIDNLDTLLAGLSDQHQWTLRSRLQSDDGPILLAAASRYPETLHDPKAAFYEFFRIQPLTQLDDNEVLVCLRNLAQSRGELGATVLAMLDSDPSRAIALNTLAGGNPRTLSVLYGVLESHMSADVLSQLSSMLDTFTGWYQARTEELPMQTRAVFDALALNWDPMTAAALGKATGLDTPTVSSQLSRLERANYVEPVSLSRHRKGRSGYQVSERFFNIWYLMRNGPRRAKQRIRFLTAFLQLCFSPSERRTLARSALDARDGDPAYVLALAHGLRSSNLRLQLVDHAARRSGETSDSDEYLDVISRIGNSGQNKRSAQIEIMTEAGGASEPNRLDKSLPHFGDLPESISREKEARALVNQAIRFGDNQDVQAAILQYDSVIARFGEAVEPAIREQVARAMLSRGFTLGKLGRSDEAITTYDTLIARFGEAVEPAIREQVIFALKAKGTKLRATEQFQLAAATYRALITLAPSSSTGYNRLGNLLLDDCGDFSGAIDSFKDGVSNSTNAESVFSLHANAAYAIAIGGGDPIEIRKHLSNSLNQQNGLSIAGRHLTMALDAWAETSATSQTDWLRVFDSIDKAISCEDSQLWTDYADDLRRMLWLILAGGEGDAFKRWMESKEIASRYAPVYHAFVAALEGEDHLLQINPETRQPAEIIHKGLKRLIDRYGRIGEKLRLQQKS